MYSLNNKKTSLVAGLILISSVAAIATSYSFIYKENNRTAGFNSNLESINRLSQLNTKWVSAVEETRNFALRDFDKIALYTKDIRANLAELDNAGLLEKEKAGEQTVNEYKIFKSSFEVKYEAIERYKSEQAILRNSANFLQASANDALANVGNLVVKEQINHSASVLNTYLLLNDMELEEEANTQLRFLESYNTQNETTLGKEAIRTYISHAKIILQYNPRVIDMLEAAGNVDIETLTKNVSSSYLSYQDIGTNITNYWRKILLGGVGGIFLAFVLFLNRFRRNSKKVQVAQEKLQLAKTKIDTVSDDILDSEKIAGRAHLALATVNTIQENTSPILTNIDLLKNLIDSNNLEDSRQGLSKLISDLEFQKSELSILNEAIFSDKADSINPFDVNKLLTKAIKTVKSETKLQVNFKTKLKRHLMAKNNPVAVFQVFLKLIRLSTHDVVDKGAELDIQLHTWSTGNYINLYMTIKGHNNLNKIYSCKGMAVVQELVDQHGISIKVETLSDNDGTIKLRLPINPAHELTSETEEPQNSFFESISSPAEEQLRHL